MKEIPIILRTEIDEVREFRITLGVVPPEYVPGNDYLLDEDGDPILTEDGEFIITE